MRHVFHLINSTRTLFAHVCMLLCRWSSLRTLFAWFGFNEAKRIGTGVWLYTERVRFTVPDPVQLITTCDPVILGAFFSCRLVAFVLYSLYRFTVDRMRVSEFNRWFTVCQYTVTQCQCQCRHSNLLSYVLCAASVASSSPKSFVILDFTSDKKMKRTFHYISINVRNSLWCRQFRAVERNIYI